MAHHRLRPISSTIGASSPSAAQEGFTLGYYALRMIRAFTTTSGSAWPSLARTTISASRLTHRRARAASELPEIYPTAKRATERGTSAGKPV